MLKNKEASRIILRAGLVFLISICFGGLLIYFLEAKREFESRAIANNIATSYAQSLEKQLSGVLSSTHALATVVKREFESRAIAHNIATSYAQSLEKQLSSGLPSTSVQKMVKEQNRMLANFDSLAEGLIDHYGGITNLQLAPNGIVKQIFPLEGYQKALGQDLNKNPYAMVAIQSKELTLEGPIKLAQGGVAVLGRYPVYLPNLETGEKEFWGFSIASIKWSTLLETTGIYELISNNYLFELSRVDAFTGQNIVFSKSNNSVLKDPLSVDIEIPNGKWILSVVPKAGWHSISYPLLEGFLVLMFSGLLSFLSYRHFRKGNELQTRKNELEKINNELEEFSVIASHDLQEPLRKIIVFGDRLAANISKKNLKGTDYLERMQSAAARMQLLINDLLKYAQLKTKPEPFKAVNLNKIIQDVLADLEIQIQKSNGIVNVGDLPTIEADPVQMHQLFLNLMGNALKFRREGVALVVDVNDSHEENGHHIITVKDNGIGIDDVHLEKIFRPLERLHRQSEYEGTGIGLSICDKIAFRHGWEITVKNNETGGVIFSISLHENQIISKT
jgi:signal transduction histidine kinase